MQSTHNTVLSSPPPPPPPEKRPSSTHTHNHTHIFMQPELTGTHPTSGCRTGRVETVLADRVLQAGRFLVAANLDQLEILTCEQQTIELVPVELSPLGYGSSCLDEGWDHLAGFLNAGSEKCINLMRAWFMICSFAGSQIDHLCICLSQCKQ